jgi:hypothetical protein
MTSPLLKRRPEWLALYREIVMTNTNETSSEREERERVNERIREAEAPTESERLENERELERHLEHVSETEGERLEREREELRRREAGR